MSIDTEGVMSTNKSSDEYAHDLMIFGGEKQNKYPNTRVTLMKKCRVVL